MRVWLVIICGCLLGEVGFSQSIKTDLERENLKGNVLCVITSQFLGDPNLVTSRSSIVSKHIVTYNKDGNILSKVTYDLLLSGDTNGLKTDYEYKNHRLVKSVQYYRVRDSIKRYTYTYTVVENEVKARLFSFDNTLDGSIDYTYDDAGNLTKEIAYDRDKKAYRQSCYKYDKGNLVSEDTKMTGIVPYVVNMAYNALDDKISEIKTFANGGKTTVIYHYFNYDKQYNWLSMDKSDKYGWTTQRVITYYK